MINDASVADAAGATLNSRTHHAHAAASAAAAKRRAAAATDASVDWGYT